jgi:hypothetical protein
MFLQLFFLLDTACRVVGIAALLVASAVAAHAIMFHPRLMPALEGKPPVAPFFTAVTALFALFVAFAAADAWGRQERAAEALGREARALGVVHATSQYLGSEAEALRAGLADYLGSTIAEEWTASRNLVPSAAATAALRRVEDGALAGLRRAADRGAPGTVWLELLRQVQDMRAARDMRLRFGSDFGQPWKWAALLLLAFASQLAIAFVQLDRRRTAGVAQAIFGAAAATALGIVAGFEGPYGGIGAVLPTPLLALQASVAAL